MIKGLGIDIVDIDRFTTMKDTLAFINKYYTKNEIQLITDREFNSTVIADNFAVKEAVSKVLGTGISGFGLQDIEVLRDEMGKPFVNLYGGAKDLSNAMGIQCIFVTISNTKELSIAAAVGEGD